MYIAKSVFFVLLLYPVTYLMRFIKRLGTTTIYYTKKLEYSVFCDLKNKIKIPSQLNM